MASRSTAKGILRVLETSAAGFDVLHERRNNANGSRNDGQNPVFGLAAIFQNDRGDFVHDPGLVQPRADNHDRYDRNNSVRGEPVEQVWNVCEIFQAGGVAEKADYHQYKYCRQINSDDF